MTAPTAPPIPAQLIADLAIQLARLRHARDDGPPNHNTRTCRGCYACVTERQLNRLLDKLPRQETHPT